MTRIGIILGSTRPGRHAHNVGAWVHELASQRTDAEFEIIDLADHPLPFLEEAVPPSFGRYQNEHTQQWAEVIKGFDGFIIVTPEYNHSLPAVLKNALDYLFAEWNNKAVAFVSYGAHGGVRAAEHLRTMAGELMMADVRSQVTLTFANDFQNHRDLVPSEWAVRSVEPMLDQLVAWSNALAPLRVAE